MGALGCGGDEKEAQSQPPPVQCPPGQFFDGQFCQMAQPMPPPAAPAPASATGPASAPVAQSGTTGTPVGQVHATTAGPNAIPLDPGAAAAATQLFAPLVQAHAMPGSKPVGSALAGQFAQGQSLEQVIPMQSGKCYTVIAVGAPPVQNVDIQLLLTVPIAGYNLTQAADTDTGNTAVIGKKPDCYKWAWPVGGQLKLMLTVSAGEGVAAAQVFEQ
jgi:hypothetical protein